MHPSLDGTMLSFWHLYSAIEKMASNKTLILFFHGNAQNLTAHSAYFYWLLKNHPVDVISFDYRGYGLSEGMPYPQGMFSDGLAALDYAYKVYRENKYKKIMVYAQSLGGYLALRSLKDFKERDALNGLILESTFKDPQKVAIQKASILGYLISGEGVHDLELTFLKMPLLVMHDRRDPVVPFSFGAALFKEIPAVKKSLIETNQGTHVATMFIDSEKNRALFLQFLNE